MNKVSKSSVRPATSMNLLSHREIAGLMASNEEVFQLFRNCALAVLNTGDEQDDTSDHDCYTPPHGSTPDSSTCRTAHIQTGKQAPCSPAREFQ